MITSTAVYAAPNTEDGMSECSAHELLSQIGVRNVRAISGGRIVTRKTGVTLPVAAGYFVTVDLAGDDTYTVRRVFVRAGKRWVKGERTGIYCEQVGEQAYKASCFRNVEFGEHAGSLSA